MSTWESEPAHDPSTGSPLMSMHRNYIVEYYFSGLTVFSFILAAFLLTLASVFLLPSLIAENKTVFLIGVYILPWLFSILAGVFVLINRRFYLWSLLKIRRRIAKAQRDGESARHLDPLTYTRGGVYMILLGSMGLILLSHTTGDLKQKVFAICIFGPVFFYTLALTALYSLRKRRKRP